MKTELRGQVRLHLLEDGIDSILWINGSRKYYIKDKVAYLVGLLIEGLNLSTNPILQDKDLVEKTLSKSAGYRDFDPDLLRVYLWFIIDSIVKASSGLDLHPILLTSSKSSILSKALTKVELALTYRCNNRCYFCYAGCPRETKELSTKDWLGILDKLNLVGIPTVNFTGGESSLRKDLVELVTYSSRYFITGFITNGRLLDSPLAKRLKSSGLSFVQITLHSFEENHDLLTGVPGSWKQTVEGIRSGVAAGLQVTTNTTLARDNYLDIPRFIEFVYSLGVRTINFNGVMVNSKGSHYTSDSTGLTYKELEGTLKTIAMIVKGFKGLRFNWLEPTCYKKLNPVKLGLGAKGCSACISTVTIEPDGNITPCQSWLHESCGNILTDDWSLIRDSDTANRLRLGSLIEECLGCEWTSLCRGACPLDRSWILV